MKPVPLCQLDMPVPTASGATVAADIYLPDAVPAPTLLVRTGSGRGSLAWEAAQWSSLGYACVVQDRHRRTPEAGEDSSDSPNEAADERAVLDWISAQPWSDGRVVPYGTGPGAGPALAAALTGHPSIVGLILVAPGSASTRRSDEPALLEWPLWAALSERTGGPAESEILGVLQTRDGSLLEQLPAASIAERVGLTREALAPDPDEEGRTLDAVRALSVPSIHISSWFDPLVEHAMALHDAAGLDTRPRPVRTQVIGPWAFPDHVRLAADCDLDFAGADEEPPQVHIASWLASLCAGKPLPASRWFRTGANAWEATAPLAIQTTEWHTGADATLQKDRAVAAASVGFRSDPRNPCPSPPHSADHAGLASRPDLLSFTTEPFAAPLSWSSARVELASSSSAATTDWIAQLQRVLPDGRVHRLGARDSEAVGDERCHQLQFPPHAVQLAAGDRLRLQISSSWFPYIARNLQCGESRWEGINCAVAEQQVHVGESGTRLILGGTS